MFVPPTPSTSTAMYGALMRERMDVDRVRTTASNYLRRFEQREVEVREAD